MIGHPFDTIFQHYLTLGVSGQIYVKKSNLATRRWHRIYSKIVKQCRISVVSRRNIFLSIEPVTLMRQAIPGRPAQHIFQGYKIQSHLYSSGFFGYTSEFLIFSQKHRSTLATKYNVELHSYIFINLGYTLYTMLPPPPLEKARLQSSINL